MVQCLLGKMARSLLVVVFSVGTASAAEVIAIALIEPLSGAFANVGEASKRHAQLAIDRVNARGGPGEKVFELLPMDSKANAQESILALQRAIDQGVRYVMQGAGSNVTHALRDAIEKHNQRNPERAVLLLNIAGNDPALVNERCSFWHFRFDPGADMKMQALTNYIAAQPSIKRVYLINQDFAFGQSVARTAREMLTTKRPDIEIVGDDLHPLGKVKDFAPYVSKITASSADTVITGNWGNDLSLLIKASNDAGLKATYLTYWANNSGSPTAIGDAGVGRIRVVAQWFANVGSARTSELVRAYREHFPGNKDDLFITTHFSAIEMLAKAMDQAKSGEPLQVAKALEGMKWVADTGEVIMRADNHQLIQPIFIASYVKADGPTVKFDAEHTGNGFRVDYRVEAKDTVLPTTCKMERP
jgi:branched-chain amino acid transport system substrate-binding protein